MTMEIQNNVSVQQVSQTAGAAAAQGTQKVENVPVGAKSAEAQQNEKVAKLVTEFKQLSQEVDGKELKNMRKDFLSTIEDKNLRKAVKKELKASQKETNEQKIEWLANDGDDTSMVEKSKLDNNHAKLQKAAKSTLLQTFRNMLTLSLFKEIN